MELALVNFQPPNPSAAGSKIVVTGVGFQPQAIIFFFSGDAGTSSVVGRNSNLGGVGFVTDEMQGHSCGEAGGDNVDPTLGTSAITNRHTLNAICTINTPGGHGELDLFSMDGDGFTLIVTNAVTVDFPRMFALCIAGVIQARTGVFQVAGATGSQSTAVGFKPDVVFFMASMASNAPPATAGGARPIYGVATATGQGLVMGLEARAGSAARSRYGITTECAGTIDDVTNTTTDRATFVSMDDNGFTVNWLERATTKFIHYLAIKGGAWFVGNFLTRTDSTSFSVSVPFKPRGLFLLSHGTAQSTTDTVQADAKVSVGAAVSPTNRAACGFFDLNGVNPTQVTRGMNFSAIYERVTGGANEGLMDLQSFDDNGFTAFMSTPDPDAALVVFVAAGQGSIPSRTPVTTPTLKPMNTPVALKAAGALRLDP